MPILLITRPEPAALVFADQARARLGCGVPVVISPLMRIEASAALPDVAGVGALIFTSRNGVEAVAHRVTDRSVPCYAVGDATAAAARDTGFQVTSAAGNADDLVQRILAERAVGPFLHLRGAHAAGDVAGRLREAGLKAEEAIVYQQIEQPLSPEADVCLSRERPVVLPLFSPRSARLFFNGRVISAPLFVAAISANVASMVPRGAVVRCDVAKRPDAKAVLDCLEGLFDAAKRLEGGNLAK